MQSIHFILCDPQKPTYVHHYPHVHVMEMSRFKKVDILIGQDNAEALVPIEVVRGKKKPFGVRTLFGWSIHGTAYHGSMEPTSHNAVSHFVSSKNIDVQISRLWSLEIPVLVGQQKTEMSLTFGMTMYVLKMDTINCRHPGRRMCLTTITMLLLPVLEASLTKSGKLEDYDCAVQMLLQKHHAEVIPEDACVNHRTWFFTPPSCDEEDDLMRLVFDCASRY